MAEYHVHNLHVDLYNILTHFDHTKYDFQIIAKFLDKKHYELIIRRLDQHCGWNIQLKIMACDFIHPPIVHTIDSSNEYEKILTIETPYEIEPSTQEITRLPIYKMINAPEPKSISLQEFNTLFNSDIVVLPKMLYAVGVKDGVMYMYNECFSHYYEIIHQISFLISVILTKNLDTNYYIFAGNDGYLEGQYHSDRLVPRKIADKEYLGNNVALNEDEYPVLHSKKYILTQSQPNIISYAIGVPDRHYFYCNLYNPFRSFHRGLSFQTKIPKIVFGARIERGYKYNFTKRRDIETNQRQYFMSDAVCKDNIVCSNGWIDNKSMVEYKYILDIDGQACTWDATAWKLNSGSVIMKTNSYWRQWFYDDYQPWINYVPIENDFSDIQEKFEWCESHQDECMQMIKNNLELFQKIFRFHNIVDYTENTLNKIWKESEN
jgi:hypothetical protein